MLTPGQEIKTFTVYRPETHGTAIGREGLTKSMTYVGKIDAVLAQAKPEEIERWRILDHPVSHKIIAGGKSTFDVLPGDIFVYNGRKFYHEANPNNIGDLDCWTVFYCNERFDV